MATQPKFPVQQKPQPRPQLVPTHPTEPPRTFRLIVAAVAVVILAAVVLVAIWMIGYGGGSPEQAPKPHQANNGTPSGLSAPVLPRL